MGVDQQMNGTFDAAFYLTAYTDVAASGLDPWEHYVRFGRSEGRAANAAELRFAELESFDAAYYLQSNPDVANAAISPYEHYFRFGKAEGRRAARALKVTPSAEAMEAAAAGYPKFDGAFYFEAFPDIAASGMTALDHYLKYGRYEGRVTHALDVAAQWHPDGCDPQRDTVMVVTHNASRTGAPILALNLCEELARRMNVIAVLLAGGPLVEHFQQVCSQTLLLDEPELRHPLVLEHLVREIDARVGVRHAIVNSSESRMMVLPLAAHGYRVAFLIHEYVSYMHSRAATVEAINRATRVVFSAQSVREDALDDDTRDALASAVVLRQGKSAIPRRPAAIESAAPAVSAAVEHSEIVAPMPDSADRIQALLDGATPRPRLVLGAGTVQFRKGVDLFFGAAAEFGRRFPGLDAMFVWIGDDDGSDLSFTACLDMQLDVIRKQGGHAYLMAPTERLESLYALADVFFLSSRMDPLPNVAIDAMTAGVPVVCFDGAGGVAEILHEAALQYSGVVSFSNIAEAADRIGDLIRDGGRREEIWEENRRLARQMFDMQSYVSALTGLLWGAEGGLTDLPVIGAQRVEARPSGE